MPNLDTKHEDHTGYHAAMLYMLREFQRLGVELVELSGVDFINQPRDATLYYLEEGARLKAAVPGQAMSLVGGVRSLADMECVLAAGFELVSLGRALIAEPDIVLADEPTGNLDVCAAKDICALLKGLNGTTRSAILVVTHDPVVAACADRVHFLKDGRIVAAHATEGDPARVSRLYLETYG